MSYVTYLHRRPDTYQIFYIGYGGIRRPWRTHSSERTKYWNEVVNVAGKPIIEVLATWECIDDALEHEKFLISCFKNLCQPLVNKAIGGKGTLGVPVPKEAKEKIGKANRGRFVSQETRAKLSIAHKGRVFSDERNRNISIKQLGEKNHNYGKKASKETREKLSISHIGKKQSPESIQKTRLAISGEKSYLYGKPELNPFYGKKHSQETKDRIRALAKGRIVSNETREKMKDSSSRALTYRCCVCGLTSKSNGISIHQRTTGHSGKEINL